MYLPLACCFLKIKYPTQHVFFSKLGIFQNKIGTKKNWVATFGILLSKFILRTKKSLAIKIKYTENEILTLAPSIKKILDPPLHNIWYTISYRLPTVFRQISQACWIPRHTSAVPWPPPNQFRPCQHRYLLPSCTQMGLQCPGRSRTHHLQREREFHR